MNVPEVLGRLASRYPGSPIVQIPQNNPTEIICEVSRTGQSSTAIAVIDRSEAHRHNHMVETYTILEGELRLYVNGIAHVLRQGDSFAIYPHQIHWAEGGAWVQVDCVPGWMAEDHTFV